MYTMELDGWEECSSCRGSGLEIGYWDVGNCYYCKGGGYVRKRDARGRFIK